MSSRFFIERPVFASVIAIVIVIAGLVTYTTLPVARYPQISPPTVRVYANYPGANAQVISDTVARVIEDEVNGVQDMLYMSSTSDNTGRYELTVMFEVGTDLDMAAVRVQNRVSIAAPQLPETVRRQGVSVKKQSSDMIIIIPLESPDGTFDTDFLSNYAAIHIRDEIARLDGVGDVQMLGTGRYSMRIWIDPDRLRSRGLTAGDVAAAIRDQNVQVAGGMVGQPPQPAGQVFQYIVDVRGRLSEPGEFERIVIKSDADGRVVRIGDVADVELGSDIYDSSAELNNSPIAAMAVYRLPGANLLETTERVKHRLAELAEDFPEGLEYRIAKDATRFVKASIAEVAETILIAAILVFLVILLFLENWRATLIPAITIPVSLIGTFVVMKAMGFSINTLTLFGMVLAIGIVVDDAIVVVENTVRHIETFGRPPKEAAIAAMEEVASPIVAITLVLMSVFLPVAFLGGVTGELYRQFALTIAASTAFSGLNALTLSPALCAVFLRGHEGRRNWFSRGFERSFSRATGAYTKVAGLAARRSAIALVLYAALSALGVLGYLNLPTGFLPTEDQGEVMLHIQLPDAASKERTMAVGDELHAIFEKIEGISYLVYLSGISIIDNALASNVGAAPVIFDHWDERKAPHLQLGALKERLEQAVAEVRDAFVLVLVPPAIESLGRSGGFSMELQDRGGVGIETLQAVADEIAAEANRQPELRGVFSTLRASAPQTFVDIDRDKVRAMGLGLSDVFGALQSSFGTLYVNDFTKFGRTYQVRIQAMREFRDTERDIGRLEVVAPDGRMVPVGTLAEVRETLGPLFIRRHNSYPSASISGQAAPGFSSGEALALIEQIARAKMPPSIGFEWSGMSLQERRSGGRAVAVLLLAVVFVYLVLCALYESWSLPFAVILVVPSALLGTVVGLMVRQFDVNVYTQVGLVVLIALSCKNSILIVEFARDLRGSGKGILESAVEAAGIRFRPVLMTSFAFIAGVSPLVIASGAGAAARQAIGTAVFSGMVSATILSVIFVPALYVVIQRASEAFTSRRTRG